MLVSLGIWIAALSYVSLAPGKSLNQQVNQLIPQPRLELATQGTARATISPVNTIYGSGWQTSLTALGRQPTDVQLTCPVATSIVAEDVHHLRVWIGVNDARTENGDGIVAITLRNRISGAVAWRTARRFTPEWTRLQIPFRPAISIPLREAEIVFDLGYRPQTIQITGLELADHGPSQDPEALPHSLTSYAGRESDAEWRFAALRRIQRTRRTTLTLKVTNRTGAPIKGQSVRIKQIGSAFQFGVSTEASPLDADRLRSIPGLEAVHFLSPVATDAEATAPQWLKNGPTIYVSRPNASGPWASILPPGTRSADASGALLAGYGMLSEGALDETRTDQLFRTWRSASTRNNEIAGFAESVLTEDTFVAPTTATTLLDRFAVLKAPILLTDFRVSSDDPALCRDALRDGLIVAYSHPAVKGFLVNERFLTRSPETRNVWDEWVGKRWRTDLTAKTDAQGIIKADVFQGEIEISTPSRSGPPSTRQLIVGKQPKTSKFVVP